MEPTPYSQSTRQRRRCHWRRSSENSLGCADLHSIPDVLWGSQASSNVQCVPKGNLDDNSPKGCMGSPGPNHMHRQNGMEPEYTTHMEEALTSPHSPCARHPSMACRDYSLTGHPSTQPRLTNIVTVDENDQSAHIHLWAPVATVFGTSPGNTPMPKRIRRTLGGVPEPPRKHGTPDAIPFTPFHFVSGVSSIQTCPAKHSYRLQQAPAKQHRVKAVRRTLDLRNAAGTTLASRKDAGWRMRRPLVARAKLGRARAAAEPPAPLFSLAEAEATLQPGEPQGHRGLPPLATTLRKRSQEAEQQHARRKLRVVHAPSQDVSPEQQSGCCPPGGIKTQPARSHKMGLSPSSRMAALQLRD